HVFECLLRAGRLDAVDMRSVLYRPPGAAEERWRELARRRMQADHRRVTEGAADDLGPLYLSLIEEYDRAGLPWERCLTRLGHAPWLPARGLTGDARAVCALVRDVSRRHGMRIMEADAAELLHEHGARPEGYRGPERP